MTYRTFSESLRERFGTKVYKLSLSTGCTCPNRDGTLGYGGCSFCSEGGSGEFAAPPLPVREQVALAKERVDRKFGAGILPEDRRYIAYFQSFTNTYGDPAKLAGIFREAASLPEIAGLSIGTRPDCLPDAMIGILSEINGEKPVWVELGLQTVHDGTAAAFGRGYRTEVFDGTFRHLKAAGLSAVVHLILGLPGETEEMMLESVRHVADLFREDAGRGGGLCAEAGGPAENGIKLQMLQILRGSRMAEEWEREAFPLLSLDGYGDLLVQCLKLLPPDTVVHRITGDGPKALLLAPRWCADKKRVLNALARKIREA